MREAIRKIDKVVNSDASILLVGETGVGKEIFAEYIHRTSIRSENAFVKISLSAMPADLLASELFGHVKGAFTSASEEKKGLFEIANNGSIFLDDIDDVPLNIQTKLLRVLEEREIMRVGDIKPIPINVKLITASKVDLKELVEKNIFRADLYYRINVVRINIPPLRERRDDIKPLVEHFLKHFSPEKKLKISKEALQILIDYNWPGNIRELRNIIQRICLFAEKEIIPIDLPAEIRGMNTIENLIKACHRCFVENSMTYGDVINCLELNLLRKALDDSQGNQSKAAKSLNLSLSTFRDKLKKFKIV
ncbi:MAG: sigma-54-dependent Fis family transcriptional regulator [Chlorobi bacterium]|nr:sigma-54-dependent Fis family transcriptional regulator [Chlorobiota bacterium]